MMQINHIYDKILFFSNYIYNLFYNIYLIYENIYYILLYGYGKYCVIAVRKERIFPVGEAFQILIDYSRINEYNLRKISLHDWYLMLGHVICDNGNRNKASFVHI